MPPLGATEEEDSLLLQDDAYVESPIKVDYGTNLRCVPFPRSHPYMSKDSFVVPRIGKGVFINFNATFLDTCVITIGARTLIGPSCSFYSGTHPLDPFLRNGIQGPELGKPIDIGEDCWFGGNVIVLPGVTIGRGVTIGAGSVVTKGKHDLDEYLTSFDTSSSSEADIITWLADIPAFHVAAGNPARIIRKIEPKERDPNLSTSADEVTVAAAAASLS